MKSDEYSKAKRSDVSKLCDILERNPLPICLLLKHFRWDSDALIAEYLERPDSVCRRVGIPVVDNNTVKEISDGLCGICFEERAEIVSLDCDHGFCPQCWQDYFHHKISCDG